MTLGALKLHDTRVGSIQPWSWKREGIALGADAATLIVLGILATLLATGLLQTHFPAGPEVARNPLFWSLLGGAAALLSWNVVIQLIRHQAPLFSEAHNESGGKIEPIIHNLDSTTVSENESESDDTLNASGSINHTAGPPKPGVADYNEEENAKLKKPKIEVQNLLLENGLLKIVTTENKFEPPSHSSFKAEKNAELERAGVIEVRNLSLKNELLKIAITTEEKSNFEPLSDSSSQMTILIPHVIYNDYSIMEETTIFDVFDFQLEIKLQGQWQVDELKKVNRLFREYLWHTYSYNLEENNILKTKFGFEGYRIKVNRDAIWYANDQTVFSSVPVLTLENATAKISFTALCVRNYQHDLSDFSITPIVQGSWFNRQSSQKVSWGEGSTRSFCHLNHDALTKIFALLPLKSQLNLRESCTYFAQLTDSTSQWYLHIYQPPRALLREISTNKASLSSFKNFAKVCSANYARSLYSDNSTAAPTLWDLQNWLPTIWPEGERCVCGKIQGIYFYSIGLNIEIDETNRWGALTAFCLIDLGIVSGFLLPKLCVDIGEERGNTTWDLPTILPEHHTLESLAGQCFNEIGRSSWHRSNKRESGNNGYNNFSIAPPY